jgi:protein-S-isoprenylcysteine O-methyltransferase Ste14
MLYLWLVLGIIWVAGALMAKREVRRQSMASFLLLTALAALAVVIGFTRVVSIGWLRLAFVPRSPVVAYTGLLLVGLGIAFAIWARFHLGGNWSGTITLKEAHTLIRRGPYSIVRHPIYSGLLTALMGTAFVEREVRGLLGVGLLLAMFVIRIRMEEKFMTEEFGVEYTEYKRRVKTLIPLLW